MDKSNSQPAAVGFIDERGGVLDVDGFLRLAGPFPMSANLEAFALAPALPEGFVKAAYNSTTGETLVRENGNWVSPKAF